MATEAMDRPCPSTLHWWRLKQEWMARRDPSKPETQEERTQRALWEAGELAYMNAYPIQPDGLEGAP